MANHPDDYVLVDPNMRLWMYYPIMMPVTADGDGPATVGDDAARITFEVWDRSCTSYSSHEFLADALNEAIRRNVAHDKLLDQQ